MKALRLVIAREFTARVRKRGYWVFTAIGLVLMVGLVFLPNIMTWVESRSMVTLAVHDPHNLVLSSLQNVENDPNALGVKLEQARDGDIGSGSATDVSNYLHKAGAKALLDVRGTSPTDASFVIEQVDSMDPMTVSSLQAILHDQVMQARVQSLGAEAQAVLTQPIPVKVESLSTNTKSSDELIESKMLVYAMEILLMVTLVIYGTWVAQGVIEEKSNRIVELLLVAARPWQVLFGKVLGVGLVGLVQYAVWLAGVSVALVTQHSTGLLKLSHVPLATLLWFPVFYVLGYLLYATLFSIGGSLVYRAEEQQIAITPISIVMVVAFYAGLAVFINPDSTFATVVSLIPLCAPLAMFARIAMTHVPVWQAALSLLLLVACIWGGIRLGESVYRRYALRTSGAAGWKLLFRQRSAAAADNGPQTKP